MQYWIFDAKKEEAQGGSIVFKFSRLNAGLIVNASVTPSVYDAKNTGAKYAA